MTKEDKAKGKKLTLIADFGKVFVRVKGNEIMKPFRADMTLFEKAGHIFKMKNDYPITYQGYKQLNKIASISIVTPQKVMIDERERLNPHVERNSKTKMIETVNIRKIGIGYSPAGNITVIDKTLYYNLYSYFIESVQAKMKKEEWKYNKDSKKNEKTGKKLHPDCAITGTENDRPEKGDSWAFFETVSPLGIWINYEDPAIIDCLNDHTQRQKFGDRIAQTIVERNILKDHPAIAVSKVNVIGTGDQKKGIVTIYGYRHEEGYPQVRQLMEQAERGDEAIHIEAEVIEDPVDLEEEAQVIKEEETGDQKKAKKEKPEKKKAAEKPPKKEEKTPAEMREPPDGFYEKEEEEGE